MSKIIVTSYPYVYERYFRVFDFFKHKSRLILILPKKWSAKGGAIQVDCPRRSDIEVIPTRAFFTHSHYLFIGGLAKGWMPALWRLVNQRGSPGDVLYTAIEPNLLTTCFNAWLAKRRGLKHVFFTWQNVPYRDRLQGLKLRLTLSIIRSTIKNSSGAIAGNSAASQIVRDLAGPSFPILQAPISGVDVDRFNAKPDDAFRSKYELTGKIIFLFAGVLDRRKGLDTLIDAFSSISSTNNNIALVLIGTGPLKDELVEHIRRVGVADKVTMIPWLDNKELPSIFSTCDVFVYPSEPVGGWREQFGFSIAEASAAKLPVISTTTGSIPEVVRDGVTGILVRPHEPTKLAEAMKRLADDPELRIRLGAAGRNSITKIFSHKVIAERFELFFEEL